MQKALMLGSERFLPEPRNTRGWPRNRRQLEWALRVVRDGMSQTAAYNEVYGSNSHDQLVTLGSRLQPFLQHLRERQAAIAEREFGVTSEKLLREVAAVALQDVVSYMRVVIVKGVRMFIGKEPDALTPMQRIAVKGWKTERIETDHGPEINYRYRMHEKRHAIDFLGRHLGMLSEKLLIEMMSKRNAQTNEDYSNVSNDDLNAAIDTLKALQERLKNSGAIDVTPERVVHSLPGGSRDQQQEADGDVK